jgi:hypothetical protein
MRLDPPRGVAWGLWLVTIVVALGLISDLDDGVAIFIAYTLFILAFATVGALVASRRPRNPLGWILLAAGLSYVLGGTSEQAVEDGVTGGLDTLLAWIGTWIWIAGIAPVATFGLLLFPDGRLPSPRWRPVARLAAGALAAVVIGLALTPGRFANTAIENPVGLEAAPWLPRGLGTAGAVALIAALAGSIASLRARYRAAGADERMQLKWLLYAAALVGANVAVSLPVEMLVGDSVANVTNAITTMTTAAVPVAMGIAILRHRLYDVDVVINRTLVYGALTATLAAGYLGGVLLAQVVIGAESGLAVAISTLAVAALFRPARARIQEAVDRRFYRRRYDAARTLEAFGARLRDEVELDLVAADLRAVARDTVQPSHVSLWLRP